MSKSFLWLLFLCALSRIVWILFVAPHAGFALFEYIDGDGYLKVAQRFADGYVIHNPGQIERVTLLTPYIAFFSQLPFDVLTVIRIWQVGLDLSIIICVYLFTKRFFNETSALFASFLYGFYPLAVYRLALVNAEVMQGASIAIWILGATSVIKNPSTNNAFLLSVLSAILILLNPAMLFIPFLFALFLWFYFHYKEIVKIYLPLLLPLLLILATWGGMNKIQTGEFFLFDTRGGITLWLGNYQQVEGRWEGPNKAIWREQYGQYKHELAGKGVNERNRFWIKKALEQISSDPLHAIEIMAKKFVRFWFVPASERMLLITYPLQAFYLALALLGVMVYGIRKWTILLPACVIMYTAGIYTLSYACIRFSHPIMPWVCMLGGIGLAWGFQKIRGEEPCQTNNESMLS